MRQIKVYKTKDVENRVGFLGASDMSKVVGHSKYGYMLQVFNEKTGRTPPSTEVKQALARGKALEYVIAQQYAETLPEDEELVVGSRLAVEILKPEDGGDYVANPTMPYLRCHPDGEIWKDGKLVAVVEFKLLSFDTRYDEKYTTPEEYIIEKNPDWWWQIQTTLLNYKEHKYDVPLRLVQMLDTVDKGQVRWELMPVLELQSEPRTQRAIKLAAAAFWKHIETDTPPAATPVLYEMPQELDNKSALIVHRDRDLETWLILSKLKNKIEDMLKKVYPRIQQKYKDVDKTRIRFQGASVLKKRQSVKRSLDLDLLVASQPKGFTLEPFYKETPPEEPYSYQPEYKKNGIKIEMDNIKKIMEYVEMLDAGKSFDRVYVNEDRRKK